MGYEHFGNKATLVHEKSKYRSNAEGILDPSCVAPLAPARLDCVMPGVQGTELGPFPAAFNSLD